MTIFPPSLLFGWDRKERATNLALRGSLRTDRSRRKVLLMGNLAFQSFGGGRGGMAG